MRELAIDTSLGRIAGLHAGTPGAPRVLALHGWLDNAASFLPLAPFLDGIELVAIDMPGHGRSAHLPAGADYSFAGALANLLDVADALGWDRFGLLGHSMGGAIASLLAAACPERVTRLLAIEAIGTLAEPPEQTVPRLREALAAQRALRDKRLRVFPDVDSAVRARQFASRVPGSGLGEAEVRLLVARGLRAVDGGYTWSSDPRLTLPTLVRMTEAQVEALVAGIACPVRAIFADPAQPYLPDGLRRSRTRLLPAGEIVVMPGGHHLHMQQPAEVAAAIGDFLRGG
ncbi:alpha/beta fold hydrolase [Thermomonas mangrovi]|uniref:alpha/beta fold hydrolase n=1 Tax=Thermomonas mangrovi TaxID=2993316 RepID=UPI002306E43A|nr:alpha/beta hydrolase [Thermomonas mangrovi]